MDLGIVREVSCLVSRGFSHSVTALYFGSSKSVLMSRLSSV